MSKERVLLSKSLSISYYRLLEELTEVCKGYFLSSIISFTLSDS